MQNLSMIIAILSGAVSLLTIVYLLGFWKGKVDSSLNEVKECIKSYPPAEMWTMVKTLWDIYVIEALHHRPDLVDHGSGYRLKKEGMDLIPEYMKPILNRIPRNPYNSEAIATGYLVVKYVGLDLINQMASEKQLTVQETIAILSTYLECQV